MGWEYRAQSNQGYLYESLGDASDKVVKTHYGREDWAAVKFRDMKNKLSNRYLRREVERALLAKIIPIKTWLKNIDQWDLAMVPFYGVHNPNRRRWKTMTKSNEQPSEPDNEPITLKRGYELIDLETQGDTCCYQLIVTFFDTKSKVSG